MATSIGASKEDTFWSVGEYFQTDQSGCIGPNWGGCNWFTGIYCVSGSAQVTCRAN